MKAAIAVTVMLALLFAGFSAAQISISNTNIQQIVSVRDANLAAIN